MARYPRCKFCDKILSPSKLSEEKWVCKQCNNIFTDEQVGWVVNGSS